MTNQPTTGTRRTTWPAADWLEETANALAWLAPYREHEGGYGMWETATKVARAILGEEQP